MTTGVHFVELKVDGRHAVLARKHCGDVVVADKPHFYQASPQPPAILLLVVERLLQLISGDQAVFNEYFAES